MKSLNNAQLIGNLTRDPEVKFLENGTAICRFSIATNRTWTQEGEKKEAVTYHNIVAWSKLGEIAGQILHKGDKAFVQGRMDTRKSEGKDGKVYYNFEVVADDIIALSSKRDSKPVSEPTETSEDISDDVPF